MKFNFNLLCILFILIVNGYKCDGIKDWFKNKIGKITGHKHDHHNHDTGHNQDGEDKHKHTLGGHVDRLINKFNPLVRSFKRMLKTSNLLLLFVHFVFYKEIFRIKWLQSWKSIKTKVAYLSFIKNSINSITS